jgi:molybdate transport system substrate-binding protein
VNVRVRTVAGLLFALLLAACAGADQADAPSAPASAPAAGAASESGSGAVSGELTVFAAASLTDAFEDIGARFEQANPDVDVAFNFESSSTLATQITEGAPADVFASASQATMDTVDEAGLVVGDRTDFAGNSLQIAVEPGNPKGIDGLEDLAQPDLTVVLAAEEVPAGEYARQALDEQGIEVEPASLETDVRAVLSRVALGEADAGIVYVTDIMAAGDDVAGIDIPEEDNVIATYPIAVVGDAGAPAQDFVDFVLSERGQEILTGYGFLPK